TSSNTISSGVCSGLGVPPTAIRHVIGVSKAYCTRVGSGPFPSELLGEQGEKLRVAGNEFGSTTGRPRRCGWLDLPQLKYAAMITGCTHIALTKLDVLNEFETISVVDQYKIGSVASDHVPFDPTEDIDDVVTSTHRGWLQRVAVDTFAELPEDVRTYISFLEEQLSIPITFVSIGPGREELIVREWN
ncbi:MAG: adenylosuccinate synthetase, partial [Saprospiraceae bacterium]